MDELYLENIDELVTDQNKIVTYKWLSHTLGVHVNQAKQMLYDYVTRKRKESLSAQVHVTYLVTGKCIQNGYSYHKVAVVKEEKLEATKAKLALVANVHVYSIQKATLKDSAPLFNTDYDIFKNNLQDCNKFGAIRCREAMPRSAEQLEKAHSQLSEEAPAPTAPTINGHVLPSAAKTASQQPKGIMGMFSRQASKAQETNKEPKTENKEPAVTNGKLSSKANAMNNFFGKASLSKLKESSPVSETVNQEEHESQSTSSAPVPVSAPPPQQTAKRSTASKAPLKGRKGNRGKRADISDSDDESDKLVKKRRRIRRPTSDSSDDEAVSPPHDVKTPSPPPPSPPAPKPDIKMETESPSQAQPGGKRRKRKRVLKSKTTVDEEGCMVTEKIYASESCTDSEGDFVTSRPAAAPKPSTTGGTKQDARTESKPTKKSSVANKGTKQASIMGFFQKK